MLTEKTMEKIVALSKNRVCISGLEIYGRFANAWDYGPLGGTQEQREKAGGGDYPEST